MGHEGLARQFPHFKKRLPGNPEKWKLVISRIVLINKFRTDLLAPSSFIARRKADSPMESKVFPKCVTASI
jgi:hypothetical protein